MTRRLVVAVSRALRARPAAGRQDRPHFHRGAQGNAAACFRPGCDRPRLEND